MKNGENAGVLDRLLDPITRCLTLDAEERIELRTVLRELGELD